MNKNSVTMYGDGYSLENKGILIRLAQKNEIPQKKSQKYMLENSGLQKKGRMLEKE